MSNDTTLGTLRVMSTLVAKLPDAANNTVVFDEYDDMEAVDIMQTTEAKAVQKQLQPEAVPVKSGKEEAKSPPAALASSSSSSSSSSSPAALPAPQTVSPSANGISKKKFQLPRSATPTGSPAVAAENKATESPQVATTPPALTKKQVLKRYVDGEAAVKKRKSHKVSKKAVPPSDDDEPATPPPAKKSKSKRNEAQESTPEQCAEEEAESARLGAAEDAAAANAHNLQQQSDAEGSDDDEEEDDDDEDVGSLAEFICEDHEVDPPSEDEMAQKRASLMEDSDVECSSVEDELLGLSQHEARKKLKEHFKTRCSKLVRKKPQAVKSVKKAKSSSKPVVQKRKRKTDKEEPAEEEDHEETHDAVNGHAVVTVKVGDVFKYGEGNGSKCDFRVTKTAFDLPAGVYSNARLKTDLSFDHIYFASCATSLGPYDLRNDKGIKPPYHFAFYRNGTTWRMIRTDEVLRKVFVDFFKNLQNTVRHRVYFDEFGSSNTIPYNLIYNKKNRNQTTGCFIPDQFLLNQLKKKERVKSLADSDAPAAAPTNRVTPTARSLIQPTMTSEAMPPPTKKTKGSAQPSSLSKLPSQSAHKATGGRMTPRLLMDTAQKARGLLQTAMANLQDSMTLPTWTKELLSVSRRLESDPSPMLQGFIEMIITTDPCLLRTYLKKMNMEVPADLEEFSHQPILPEAATLKQALSTTEESLQCSSAACTTAEEKCEKLSKEIVNLKKRIAELEAERADEEAEEVSPTQANFMSALLKPRK